MSDSAAVRKAWDQLGDGMRQTVERALAVLASGVTPAVAEAGPNFTTLVLYAVSAEAGRDLAPLVPLLARQLDLTLGGSWHVDIAVRVEVK